MSRRLLVPTLATLVSLAILLALGAWQWRRMGEKRVLIDTIAARTAMAPQAYPSAGASFEPETLEYAPVTVTGAYLPGVEAHVFFSLARPVGGYSGPGYLVLAPFRLEGGRIILVNRGFVPQPLKEPASRPAGQPDGPQTITGLLRLPERRLMFSGADDPAKNIYYVREPAALARGLALDKVANAGGIENFIIDLKTPVPPGGLPVPGVTQIDIPNNHFQYALTWWSLAAVLAVIFLIYARQQSAAEA